MVKRKRRASGLFYGVFIMTMQKYDLEQVIKEDLYGEAEAILKEVDASGMEAVTGTLKDDIRRKLQERIDTYEEERTYAALSDKDKEALALGRKLQEERTAAQKTRTKRRRLYAVSAAAVLALAVGMTSMGGAERIISVIEQAVGGRSVVKVNSDEENKISENEDEQKAYQKIKEAFKVAPVKVIKPEKGMKFVSMDLDESLQLAELLYQYNDSNFWYIVSAGYYDSSFGIDADDEILDKEELDVEGNMIELTTYRLKETKEIKHLAHFTCQKLEYFLLGSMEKKDFELILENLYFF